MEENVYRVMGAAEERHWWFRGRRRVIEALLERAAPPPGARILDAGCGTGRNLELYAGWGDPSGVDPHPEAVDYCRARGFSDVQVGGAEDLPYDDASTDLIAATDVLEHVRDDATALREMHRVAAPGAALLLTVPAYEWMWSDEDLRLGHHRRYTLPRLRASVEAAGWRPEFGTHFNLILLPPIAAARKLSAGRKEEGEIELTPGWLDTPLSMPMRLEAQLIRRGVRLPAGVSIGLVCRRS